jgi:hypothetical protein
MVLRRRSFGTIRDQPIELTAETVAKRVDFALGWPEQRAQLGFD